MLRPHLRAIQRAGRARRLARANAARKEPDDPRGEAILRATFSLYPSDLALVEVHRQQLAAGRRRTTSRSFAIRSLIRAGYKTLDAGPDSAR